MLTPWSAIRDRFMRYASNLRFPRLLAVTATLFVIDLLFPDVVPFVDEILLGLISLIFASLRKRNGETSHKNEKGEEI
jgi:Na+/H+ antiporter NhaD/arsenite permease-like protein